MSRRVWQIAGGPSGRSYSNVFLRHGVGLIGPGDPGAWTPGRPDEDFDNSSSVRRFATEPQRGDLVLLRAGNCARRSKHQSANARATFFRVFSGPRFSNSRRRITSLISASSLTNSGLATAPITFTILSCHWLKIVIDLTATFDGSALNDAKSDLREIVRDLGLDGSIAIE